MQRSTFIKNATLCAFAVSTSGFIRFNGNKYVGDCETTTDILGPFYRPGSPLRNNLLIKNEPGDIVELSGVVRHKDCKTPCKKARIEIWHCSSGGDYDNTSDEFRYRGTTYTDQKGNYFFKTILPVPYSVGSNNFRPAHYHLMITAEGYQPLVTQLYFSGDKNIQKDASASSPHAKRRILNVQTAKGGKRSVLFDISMSEKLSAEPAAIERLTGVYTDEKDANNKTEFFKKNNALWMKNEVYGYHFEYIGDNTFQYPGIPPDRRLTVRFEILAHGDIKVIKTMAGENRETQIDVAIKMK